MSQAVIAQRQAELTRLRNERSSVEAELERLKSGVTQQKQAAAIARLPQAAPPPPAPRRSKIPSPKALALGAGVLAVAFFAWKAR